MRDAGRAAAAVVVSAKQVVAVVKVGTARLTESTESAQAVVMRDVSVAWAVEFRTNDSSFIGSLDSRVSVLSNPKAKPCRVSF